MSRRDVRSTEENKTSNDGGLQHHIPSSNNFLRKCFNIIISFFDAVMVSSSCIVFLPFLNLSTTI